MSSPPNPPNDRLTNADFVDRGQPASPDDHDATAEQLHPLAIQADDSVYVDLVWTDAIPFTDPDSAKRLIVRITQLIDDDAWAARFRHQLVEALKEVPEPDRLVSDLFRFLRTNPDPLQTLALFDRDEKSLGSLFKLFSVSETLARRIIADSVGFVELLQHRDAPRPPKQWLVNDLLDRLSDVKQFQRAAPVIGSFYSRELTRVAYDEFVQGLAPDKVGRSLTQLADAVIEVALQFTFERLVDKRGVPLRPDGTPPKVTVVGLGNLGGEEVSYGSPLQLIFLFDSIDYRNTWHRDFYETLVRELIELLCGTGTRDELIDIDLRSGPRFEVGGVICSVREAARIYETSGRPWQRLQFVKARVVAGSRSVGHQFLDRLKPWIYRQYAGNAEYAELQAIRNKLLKRCKETANTVAVTTDKLVDIHRVAGGRRDLEFAVQFLQILHGAYLPTVRQTRFLEAVNSLRHQNCLSEKEAKVLADHFARLTKLENLLAIYSDGRKALPVQKTIRDRLVWNLGIRREDGRSGNLERFDELLTRTFAENQKLIHDLMSDARFERMDRDEPDIETELVLDPSPDASEVEQTMRQHGLTNPEQAMDHLTALCNETIPFLSPHHCRHAFASLAPKLLREVSKTPDPDETLAMLVRVTDSLGAKAMLWDLLQIHAPTLELLTRLCAATPYLTRILVNHPGMIDELMDSLRVNHLPTTGKIDAHSIEICRRAADLDSVLHGLKNSLHLTIGVREILSKELIDATQATIGDTAEACVRRVLEYEYEQVAGKFGDPVDADGNPVEMHAIALGKLGGREPNYHSDLDVAFLYLADGETKRRVGGRRATTNNRHFYNQVARQTITRINQAGELGRLYELGCRLKPADEGVLVASQDDFFQRFEGHQAAPLWQRLALCKARVISGNRIARQQTEDRIRNAIASTQWQPAMATEIREMRSRLETTASTENFKRGMGGTLDAEWVAQTLTLKNAQHDPSIIRSGTIESLTRLSEAGLLGPEEAESLIKGYRMIRRIEAHLCLMSFAPRHELPDDESQCRHLAFLLRENETDSLHAQCHQVRVKNRNAFDQIFDRLEQQSG